MKSILEIPDNPVEINRWIEELVLSGNFSTLVGQLEVVNELADEEPTLVISDDRLGMIVDCGLGKATADECRALLRSPQKLVELRQRIFEVGSTYWLGKIKNNSSETQFLKDFASGLFSANSKNSTDFEPDSVVELSSDSSRLIAKSTRPEVSNRLLRRLISVAAVLAFLGLGVYFVLELSSRGSSDWGWQAANSIPDTTDPRDYFDSLGRSGLEWFDQQRNSPAQLVARLEEYSSGCQRLINAPHSPLGEQDRNWLLDKCKAWKIKIDQLASAARKLDSSSDAEFERIKDSADDLASKIGLLLSRRAQSA